MLNMASIVNLRYKNTLVLAVTIFIFLLMAFTFLHEIVFFKEKKIFPSLTMKGIMRVAKFEFPNFSGGQLEQSTKNRLLRDAMSKHLNQVMHAYGQLNCEHIMTLQAAGMEIDPRVSETGSWCPQASDKDSGSHIMDEGFGTALSKFLKDKVVGSFGDGPGKYKKHIDSLGEVKQYMAFDGAPYCENMTHGKVKFMDLTIPQYGIQAFDWVVSVEVGEHIPASFESIYLDNLVRHAREGIILSWAPPGQDGLSHVNNKPLEEVVGELKLRGFDIDIKAGEPLREQAKLSWLQQNVHVYKRIDKSTFNEDDV